MNLRIFIALWPAVVGGLLSAQEVRLSPECRLRFADVEQGAAILGAEDDFTRRLSRFDLQSRLRSAAELTSADYRSTVVGGIRPWSDPFIELVLPAAKRLAQALDDYQLPLPAEIFLVCTSGDGEAGAPHTRANAIVLPQQRLNDRPDDLLRLLAHELFHIMSRHSPGLRDQLYAAIGFQPCGEIRLPEALRERRITNPDAPIVQHLIEVTVAGEQVQVAPVLLANVPQYDPSRTEAFFAFLDVRFVQLQRQAGQWTPELREDGSIIGHRIDELENFMQQVGNNTRYLIHPEEILADNFSYLVTGKSVPSPEVLDRIEVLLKP